MPAPDVVDTGRAAGRERSATESAADFLGLVEPDILWRWLPAVLAAAFIRWAILHWFKSLAMPADYLCCCSACFLPQRHCSGLSPAELMADGWLVGPFPESQPTLWNPVLLERSADIDWALVVQHLASIGTVTMLSAVSLMLTASGLSVLLRDNVDINRELTVAGAANAISGVSGGLLALPSMTLTDLAVTVGAPKSRLVGLVVALFCALALFFGMSLIAWFPKAVLAGLLLFLGWSLLERWLIEARSATAGAGVPGGGHHRAGGGIRWASSRACWWG